MKLSFPELSLVLLVGPSGCGKSTFARQHFRSTEVLSSDFFRGLICDDEGSQAASRDAFDLLHQVVARRLAWRRFTVIDATNLQPEGRKPLHELARKYHYLTAAIVFDLAEEVCQARNRLRPDRFVPERVITQQNILLQKTLGALERESFRSIYTFRSTEEMASATVERRPLREDRSGDRGPFDFIGDVHGCFEELVELLGKLGYQVAPEPPFAVIPPPGRKAVFVGDLGDRGPRTPDVYRLIIGMVEAGHALCVLGNHDNKLLRKLRGNDVTVSHGLAETLAQLEPEPPEFKARIRNFLDSLVTHYLLDEGKLVVAHAGLRADLQGRVGARVRSFALFGDTTGESDEHGLPVRLNWAADYRGPARVIYGHTPVAEPSWLNNTMNIDTGCVFGGRLTALRHPESELVSVPARRQYCEPGRPFLQDGAPSGPAVNAQQLADDVLDLEDVRGRRLVSTALAVNVMVEAERAQAALEIITRFAADPRWLVYLPPTMAPCETSRLPGYLEHPAEAFGYFRKAEQTRVICQEKHMGSRAVAIVCRSADVARRVFGVSEGDGAILTRTGRRFFEDLAREGELLAELRRALTDTGCWERWQSDWVCLDAELMPWSAKAQELLRNQYAAVGAAGRAALSVAEPLLRQTAAANPEAQPLAERIGQRASAVADFVTAYRRYCWPVLSVNDLRLAPFHVLATEGVVHSDKPHAWHLEMIDQLCQAGGVLQRTERLVVELNDPASVEAGERWWEELTAKGGEGMVVKPEGFVVRNPRGLVQPALKCRGREYLRIIYGPEYLAAENLSRLRQRSVGAKRGLALREFALGLEALARFVAREPLRRVHECCFALLALETEPIDPRL